MTDASDLHDRLQVLFDRLKEFPEARICEHGATLKPDAHLALLELRKLIEGQILPHLARNAKRGQPSG